MTGGPALPTAQYLRFESYREYEDRFDALIPRALSVIRIFDTRLPRRYNTRGRCDLLRAFLRGDQTRQLLIIVHETEPMVRECPRLLELVSEHSSQARMRRTLPAARQARDPCIVVDSSHYLHRFHQASMRAAQGLDDPPGAQQLIERYGEIWTASVAVRAGAPAGL